MILFLRFVGSGDSLLTWLIIQLHAARSKARITPPHLGMKIGGWIPQMTHLVGARTHPAVDAENNLQKKLTLQQT